MGIAVAYKVVALRTGAGRAVYGDGSDLICF